ncbi:MAG: hypothetical protein WC312_07900 [Candidatus Omnitrophota bacterium]|jgi:hypothetical protein
MKNLRESAEQAFEIFIGKYPLLHELQIPSVIRDIFLEGYLEGLKQGVRESAKAIREDMENSLLILGDIKDVNTDWGIN